MEASIWFGLALLARTNGILNIGFLGFALLSHAANQLPNQPNFCRRCFTVIKCSLFGMFCAGVVLAPYCYQIANMYAVFCDPHYKVSAKLDAIAKKNGYVLAGDIDKLPWCKWTV